MTVVGEVGVLIVVVAGFVDRAVQVPVPVAAIVTGLYWQLLISGPALGLAVTITLAVSGVVHPVPLHIKT